MIPYNFMGFLMISHNSHDSQIISYYSYGSLNLQMISYDFTYDFLCFPHDFLATGHMIFQVFKHSSFMLKIVAINP